MAVLLLADEVIAPHNLHPFLGIFVDEQDHSKRDKQPIR